MYITADITHQQPQNPHRAPKWTWSNLWSVTPCSCWPTLLVHLHSEQLPGKARGSVRAWGSEILVSGQGSYVIDGCDSFPPRKHPCGYTDMQLLLLLQEWEWAVSVYDSHQRGVYSGTWGGRFAHRCFIFTFVTELVLWEQFQSFLWNTNMQHLMCLESEAQHVGRLLAVYSMGCCLKCLLWVFLTPNTQAHCIIFVAGH